MIEQALLHPVNKITIANLNPFFPLYSLGDSIIPGTVETNNPPKLEQKLIVTEMFTWVKIESKNTTISANIGQISLRAISLPVSSLGLTSYSYSVISY